ncbi:TPA: phage tail tip fiber protein [Enterobacter hormaechei]
MKHLPLKAVMIGLDIIETDEGYELHSPAGEAKYDAWGARREVNGIPEYFPSSISMKKRVPAATDVKKTESIALSGAATDVLYALFFRGALQSGDLPAKSGAAELRELGFAETRHTATEYQKENYFTFLTAEGQEFAIKHLADTRFGKPVDKQYRSAITIGVELDTSDVQKTIDELDDKIRNSDAFKVLKDGWSFEKNGTLIINNGQVFITDAKISDGVLSTNYNVKLNDADKGKPHEAGMTLGIEGDQSKVEFKADRFNVHEAASSIIGNAVVSAKKMKIKLGDEMTQAIIDAVRESDLFAALQAKIDAQTASVVGLQQAMHEAVNDALRNALKPGGILWNTRSSGL